MIKRLQSLYQIHKALLLQSNNKNSSLLIIFNFLITFPFILMQSFKNHRNKSIAKKLGNENISSSEQRAIEKYNGTVLASLAYKPDAQYYSEQLSNFEILTNVVYELESGEAYITKEGYDFLYR